MMMVSKHHASSVGFSDSGGMGGGGVGWGGGDDDDIGTRTHRTISPQEPFFSRYLQYFRDVGPSYMIN